MRADALARCRIDRWASGVTGAQKFPDARRAPIVMVLAECRDPVECPLRQAVHRIEIRVQKQTEPVQTTPFGMELSAQLVDQVDGNPDGIGGAGLTSSTLRVPDATLDRSPSRMM